MSLAKKSGRGWDHHSVDMRTQWGYKLPWGMYNPCDWLIFLFLTISSVRGRCQKKPWPNEGQGVRLDNPSPWMKYEIMKDAWKTCHHRGRKEPQRFQFGIGFCGKGGEKVTFETLWPQVHPYEGLGMNSHTWGLKTITWDFTQKWRQR